MEATKDRDDRQRDQQDEDERPRRTYDLENVAHFLRLTMTVLHRRKLPAYGSILRDRGPICRACRFTC